jgi:hypothetical protein
VSLWLLIGFAVIVAVIVVLGATRPAAYQLERKIDVAAAPERVFAVLDDLRQFTSGVLVIFGEPRDKPKLQKTFSGPERGVGQTVEWSGDGAGKLAIEESVAGKKLRIRLEFTAPMKSIATYVITLDGSSTVTWTMSGEHNFIGRVFGLFMNMDKALGADVEKSLARLKALAEASGG